MPPLLNISYELAMQSYINLMHKITLEVLRIDITPALTPSGAGKQQTAYTLAVPGTQHLTIRRLSSVSECRRLDRAFCTFSPDGDTVYRWNSMRLPLLTAAVAPCIQPV